MRALAHLIGKELLLLRRDWHALLLLFAMPTAFILVMSLALQNQFSAQGSVQISYALIDHGSGDAHAEFARRLATVPGFERVAATGTESTMKQQVRQGNVQFLVVLSPNFGAPPNARMDTGTAHPAATVEVYAAPDVGAAVYQLFAAGLHKVVGQIRLAQMGLTPDASTDGDDASTVAMHTLYASSARQETPNSVQQNVPAWLLFAMFFIAVPLSTTWLQERDQGTYARLRSLGLSAPTLLCGKLIPYLLLNLVQVVLMLLVGVYVVPWCGGDALTLGQSWPALALVSAAAGFAAVGYALLVANLVTTSEQATLFTGVANLLMAAVGGIMVPRFIMPHSLQVLSQYSPMSWGLDGFLDVFLRGGGVTVVASAALKLALFGAACLALAAASMTWRNAR